MNKVPESTADEIAQRAKRDETAILLQKAGWVARAKAVDDAIAEHEAKRDDPWTHCGKPIQVVGTMIRCTICSYRGH